MATVYRAWDRRLGVWRAIKLLSQDRKHSGYALDRFEAEARLMARVDHPNIVRVYDLDWHGARPYIVQELVKGGSVYRWMVRSHQPMPPRWAVQVAIDVCRGLAAAHERGVIHRDVKTKNVLIGPGGVCKLADFGVARLQGRAIDRRGAVLGTVGYMAPEQRVDPGAVDVRADVYGVGATLYSLATRRRPVDLFEAERDPSRLRRVPRALRPIVRRATAYDCADRFDDCVEMLFHLEALLHQLPEPDPGSAPPLYVPQEDDLAFGNVPTGPAQSARARSRLSQITTDPIPDARQMLPEAYDPEAPFSIGREPLMSNELWRSWWLGMGVGAACVSLAALVLAVLM